jgi:hypothetical protein
MAEYIEREAVLKIIGDNCPRDKCGYNTEEEMGAGAACYYIRKDVEKIPTADVVEVVRCKDCVHYKDGGCNHFGYYTYAPDVDEDDFCSYGEKVVNDNDR